MSQDNSSSTNKTSEDMDTTVLENLLKASLEKNKRLQTTHRRFISVLRSTSHQYTSLLSTLALMTEAIQSSQKDCDALLSVFEQIYEEEKEKQEQGIQSGGTG